MDNGNTETGIVILRQTESIFGPEDTPKNFFILQIKSKDVELLIRDVEFKKEGGVINLIIDPFDIIKFCFPYGLRFQHKPTLDKVGDEMLAYYHIFDNYRPIILDEYKIELELNRAYAYNHIEKLNEKSSNLKIFLQKYENATPTRRKNLLKELEESFSFLLSSAILAESYIKHLDEIYRKLQINSFLLKERNIEAENFILKAFRDNKRTEWTTTAFKQWVIESERRGFFEGANKHSLIQPAFRDFGVIDRVCNINKYLQTNQERGKYLMLYFSSANRSEEIFLNEITQKHLPTVEGIDRFNVLRSARHAFVMFLLGGQDDDTILTALNELKEITNKWEAENSEKAIIKENVQNIKTKEVGKWLEKYNLKDVRREALERESITRRINEHEKFRDALNDTITKLKEDNFDDVAKYFEDFLKKAQIAQSSIKTLATISLGYSVESNLTELVKQVFIENQTGKELNLHTGLDSILGSYHHLPILLFLNDQDLIPEGLSDLLNEVVEFVVKPPGKRKATIEEFFYKISELYIKSERIFSKTHESYSGALVKVFIYLISPHREGVKKQEEEAHDFLVNMIELLTIGTIARDEKLAHLFSLFGKLENDYYQKVKSEYQYFLIWTYRRNNKIKESLKLSEDAISEDSKDPRFYHGKCLALYNNYISLENLSVGKLNDLKELTKNAEQSISLYREIKIEKYQTNKKYINFIDGSIVALQNTLLYSISLYYLDLLEKDPTLETFERFQFSDYPLATTHGKTLRQKLFNPIRTFEKNTHKQDPKELPEIAHTEAVLELCEAVYYFESKTELGKENAKRKIIYAKNAIEKSLEHESNLQLYLVTKEKIEEWQSKMNR